jgi:hypothetical protein
MKSENGTVYMIRGHDDDEWVSPEPAEAVITEALFDATDLTDDDIDYIGSYVDAAKLRGVVGDGDDDTITFDVEGNEVTVTAGGTVTVA